MLGAEPSIVMPQICAKWGIPWTDTMINWALPYGAKTWFSNEARDRMMNDPRFRKSKESLEASTKYNYRSSPMIAIVERHKKHIRKHLLPLYEQATAYANEDFWLTRKIDR